MSVSVAFSQGKPFRTPIYKNYFFLLSLFVLLLFDLFVLFLAPQELDDFLLIRTIPDLYFEILLVSIAAVHFLISVGFEMLVVEPRWIWIFIHQNCSWCFSKHISKRYKTLLRGLETTSGTDPGCDHEAAMENPNPWLALNKPLKSRSRVTGSAEIKTQL